MTDDLHWFAGLYEGEGWIGNPRPNTLHIRIGSNDLDVLERAQKVFGVGRIYGPYTNKKHPHWKPHYQLDFSSRKAYAVGVALLAMGMSERRTEQLLATIRTWLKVPGWGRG